jgi:hypothetical protein
MRELQRNVWLLETIDGKAAGALPAAATQEITPAEQTTPQDGTPTPARGHWPEPQQRNWQEVRFLNGGHCGRWSDVRRTFWEMREKDGAVHLRFAGKGGAEMPTAELKLQSDGSWRGRSLGSDDPVKLRLVAVQDVYPSATGHGANGSRSKAGAPPRRAQISARKIHVFNSAHGIGDHVTALYACAGAANAGFEVTFHTRFG